MILVCLRYTVCHGISGAPILVLSVKNRGLWTKSCPYVEFHSERRSETYVPLTPTDHTHSVDIYASWFLASPQSHYDIDTQDDQKWEDSRNRVSTSWTICLYNFPAPFYFVKCNMPTIKCWCWLTPMVTPKKLDFNLSVSFFLYCHLGSSWWNINFGSEYGLVCTLGTFCKKPRHSLDWASGHPVAPHRYSHVFKPVGEDESLENTWCRVLLGCSSTMWHFVEDFPPVEITLLQILPSHFSQFPLVRPFGIGIPNGSQTERNWDNQLISQNPEWFKASEESR